LLTNLGLEFITELLSKEDG